MNLALELQANPVHRNALLHLYRAGGSMTVADFDKAAAPHGALMRRDLSPSLARESGDKVFLTTTGRTEIAKWA